MFLALALVSDDRPTEAVRILLDLLLTNPGPPERYARSLRNYTDDLGRTSGRALAVSARGATRLTPLAGRALQRLVLRTALQRRAILRLALDPARCGEQNSERGPRQPS